MALTVKESELHFGDNFSVLVTDPPKLRTNQSLWLRAEVTNDETTILGLPDPDNDPSTPQLVYAQYCSVASNPQPQPFTLGPTPTWVGGGGNGLVRLLIQDNGAFKEVRRGGTVTFKVLP